MRSLQKKMMDYCTYCPKMCRFTCPVSEVTKNETTTPWGKMQVGKWLSESIIPLNEDTISAAYQCTNCLHCQKYCEHLNDVPEALREIRNLAVENYVAPPEAYRVQKNFSKFNNPYGVDLSRKFKNPKSLELYNDNAGVLFFPSCHTRHLFPDRIRVYFELFDKLGIKNLTLATGLVPCCGEPLRALGFQDDFQEIAEIQCHAFEEYTTVVVDGPECSASLLQNYTVEGFPVRTPVLPLMEFLHPYLEHSNYRTLAKVKGRLAYHDPSHLARHLHITDLPRKIISLVTGFSPVDLSQSHEDTLSSGAEGSYEMIFPDISNQIAERIVREVSARRIKKLLTACAKSEAKFRSLAEDFEVQDIYEYLNDHILKD